MKAMWNGAVIAESDTTVQIEGNHYFPRDSVNAEYLSDSSTHTTCPWKGLASYYTIEANGEQLPDGAWYYPNAKTAAKNIEKSPRRSSMSWDTATRATRTP